MAVIDTVPAVENVVESVAVPELSVPVPSEVVPLKNVTVPVAVEGETVAVKVTLVPTTGVVVDGVSVVVEAVVPAGDCQKSPQPASSPASPNVSSKRTKPVQIGLSFIHTPLSQRREMNQRIDIIGLWNQLTSSTRFDFIPMCGAAHMLDSACCIRPHSTACFQTDSRSDSSPPTAVGSFTAVDILEPVFPFGLTFDPNR